MKDWTLTGEVAGCGIMFGKHIAVELFGSSFGINMENLFGSIGELFSNLFRSDVTII
jgi:hypothetical protein